MALKNEIQQLSDWVFELDNKRKAAEKNQRSTKKMYMRAKCDAYLQLHKLRSMVGQWKCFSNVCLTR
jgi:hypothetical protein